MEKLIQTIRDIQAKLDALRRRSLKEASTRKIVIDELLAALGWDVLNPDEVELECPTVDAKSVDYALKLNAEPVLLVEAKALDDSLENVKDIAQVTGYAANEGIPWCILTNGITWKVYHSIHKCHAPDKRMFEVSIDPKDAQGLSPGKLAERMWRFSRDEMAKGTLDFLGEQVFTDDKVRKSLSLLMRDPPRPLLNIVCKAVGDSDIPPQKIKASLARVSKSLVSTSPGPVKMPQGVQVESTRSEGAKKAWQTRRGKPPKKDYPEDLHTGSQPREVLELYAAVERVCLAMKPGGVTKRILAKSINYEIEGRTFCAIHLQRAGLRVWLWLKYSRVVNPPVFARDVSNVGHWGGGDLELGISNLSQLDEADRLIRQSFEGRLARKA